MNPEDVVRFLPAEELFAKASKIFAAQKKELEGILPPLDIQQVGSSSVPGLTGKLDVDVQIRTTREQFEGIVETLRKHYAPKHPELWHDGIAIFCNNKEFLIDLIVTVIGSEHDNFYKERDMLMADERLREEYNELKRQYQGKPYVDYKKAKVTFLHKYGMVSGS